MRPLALHHLDRMLIHVKCNLPSQRFIRLFVETIIPFGRKSISIPAHSLWKSANIKCHKHDSNISESRTAQHINKVYVDDTRYRIMLLTSILTHYYFSAYSSMAFLFDLSVAVCPIVTFNIHQTPRNITIVTNSVCWNDVVGGCALLLLSFVWYSIEGLIFINQIKLSYG